MPPPITSRRLLVPVVIVMLLISSLLPARYCFYGPPLHNALMVLLRPVSVRLNVLGSRLHGRGGLQVDRTLEQLQEEIHVLEGDLRRVQEENRQLREQITQLSGLQQRMGASRYRPVFSRVIGRNTDPGSESLIIDAGTRDGLDVGMVVADVGASGFGGPQLVGRVVQVQPATAVVRPLTATGTRLSLELAGDPQQWTLFRATGTDRLLADDARRDLLVQERDVARLASAPGLNQWPPEAHFMLVGTVSRVAPHPTEPLLQHIEVQPIRPLMHLSEVMVLIPGSAASPAPSQETGR